MKQIRVEQVQDKKGLLDFINVTRTVYKDDPNFVQPLTLERLDSLSAAKNPYFEHTEVAFFVAYQNDIPVGSISAQIDSLAQEKWGPNLGHFGLFEAVSQEVATALFDQAETWLKERGMKRMQGPWSLSANEQCGMLIDGFDTPNMIMMPHGLPAYQDWTAAYGFEKAKDLYALQIGVDKEPPARIKRIWENAKKNEHINLRKINMKDFDNELAIIFDIFNDAWQNNWGYVPFTAAELEHTAKTLKPLIKDYRTFIVEYDGEPAGFMVSIPDVNYKIRDLDGNLFPFGIFKLIWRMFLSKREDRFRVPLMGIRQKFQKKPVGAMLPFMMTEETRIEMHKRGGYFCEMGWILEDNGGMISIIEKTGGSIYKTMRIWEKEIA
ncbi:DNA-binding protein [Kordiimonas sediminis]|uniref:DNA-binding protein n=1 Tax=Kordiimonas sediminis TaxID=1735581 RepID=A0A919E8H6_9PROT|nr:GNAT family N-acetyltransferase [Kordiimonas sediminis]GHF25177.1 DNA-binding protein [Kordiimonas sediminis]